MKRIIYLSGLALFVTATALAGCGSDDKDSGAKSTTAETVVDVTTAVGGETTEPSPAGGDHTPEEIAAAEAAADNALAPFADDPDIPADMMQCLHAGLTDEALEMGPDTFTERYEAGEADSEFIGILGQVADSCGFT